MKKALSILALILFATTGIYSQKSAVVLYEEIVTLNIELLDNLPQEVKDKIPKQRVHQFELSYDGNTALYANASTGESSDVDITSGDEENEFQFKIQAPKYAVYTNRDEDRFVGEQEFMGKAFLIVDQCRPNDWKITSEQKTVMNIPCIKATNGDGAIAWFAPSITAPHGPNGYGGLPGLILAMEFPENNREVLAKAINDTPTNAADLKEPKKGKKVTRKEFDEIVDKKMKEMGAEGSGGMRIITIEEEN